MTCVACLEDHEFGKGSYSAPGACPLPAFCLSGLCSSPSARDAFAARAAASVSIFASPLACSWCWYRRSPTEERLPNFPGGNHSCWGRRWGQASIAISGTRAARAPQRYAHCVIWTSAAIHNLLDDLRVTQQADNRPRALPSPQPLFPLPLLQSRCQRNLAEANLSLNSH